MDQHEIDLVEKYSKTDPELKSLWEDHLLYAKKVEKLESKSFRTPAEQQELKLLKKQKLDGKTKLMHILDQLKQAEQSK